MSNSINLGGSLQGTIDNMLTGSVAGNIAFSGGTPAVIQEKNITENGTYNAPSGVDGFNPVVVNVPTPQPVIQSKNITENGTYSAPSGVDGFSPINVNVQPNLIDKVITGNGTYTPPSGYDGFSEVTVDVPIRSEQPITITENGVFNVPSNKVYNPITVNVTNAVPIISSNVGKFKLGIAEIDNNNELVLTFTDATINAVENMDIFTNQRLSEGIDTSTLKLCKAYSSSDQTTQIGWVGFYQNSIRAWNIDQTANILLEHIYCTLVLSDSTVAQNDNPYISL